MGGIAVGFSFLSGLLFDPNCPYTGCRLCGAVFQSGLDRDENSDKFEAMEYRKLWSVRHAKTHPEREHLALAMSGMWCTPEAAQKFASYGIIALSDMVLFEETAQALKEGKSIPIEDVEGRSKKLVL